MIFKSNNLLNAIILYICIIILIIYTKPNFLYDNKTKKFKEFGFNDEKKTIITFQMLSILIAILSYVFIAYIKNINQLKKNYEKILTERIC
jgi:hypothetical protein